MIFVSDTLQGAFGRAWRAARRGGRRKLLEDFAERPIFSVGVFGGAVPSHDSHPETWHALLSGIKAWWLGKGKKKSAVGGFGGWEDPCGAIERSMRGEAWPADVSLCVQHPGDVLYFGDGVEHATCTLSNFSLAVGSQGHTETWPELIRASNRGDLAKVRQIFKASPGPGPHLAAVAATAGSYGHTALHRAALHGFGEVASALLGRGADAGRRDSEGLTPAFLAAFSGHREVLKTLADHGVVLARERDSKGASPLQWAVTQGHAALVDLLIDTYGTPAGATDFHGGGPASAAATMGHAVILQKLVDSRANVEESDDRAMRPLHWAALHGHGPVVQHLLHLRVQLESTNANGQRAVDLAQERSWTEVVNILKQKREKAKRKRKHVSHKEL